MTETEKEEEKEILKQKRIDNMKQVWGNLEDEDSLALQITPLHKTDKMELENKDYLFLKVLKDISNQLNNISKKL